MAERVGFEPTVGFLLHSLSRRALSTAQTPLRGVDVFIVAERFRFRQSARSRDALRKPGERGGRKVFRECAMPSDHKRRRAIRSKAAEYVPRRDGRRRTNGLPRRNPRPAL